MAPDRADTYGESDAAEPVLDQETDNRLGAGMTVETLLQDALDRVETERAHVSEKVTAFSQFRAGVHELAPASAQPGPPGAMADGGMTATTTTLSMRSSSGCQQVRRLFEETVEPVSTTETDETESTVELLREEFCDEIALAVSPHTEGQFTPGVKQAMLTATDNRRQELGALEKALAVETESLEAAESPVREMTAWLASADERPLLELGFEQLRERHERLAEFRERCTEIADRRQETLEQTTSYEGSAGIEHKGVVGYLYEDFPTAHPVLSTATNLDDVCADCQRAVRDHLTRRV